MTELKPITRLFQNFKNIFKVDIFIILQIWTKELESLEKPDQLICVLKNVKIDLIHPKTIALRIYWTHERMYLKRWISNLLWSGVKNMWVQLTHMIWSYDYLVSFVGEVMYISRFMGHSLNVKVLMKCSSIYQSFRIWLFIRNYGYVEHGIVWIYYWNSW